MTLSFDSFVVGRVPGAETFGPSLSHMTREVARACPVEMRCWLKQGQAPRPLMEWALQSQLTRNRRAHRPIAREGLQTPLSMGRRAPSAIADGMAPLVAIGDPRLVRGPACGALSAASALWLVGARWCRHERLELAG